VLAAYVKENNGIYATIRSSETNTFREKLLRGEFSEFSKRCRKYIFKYILEVVQGNNDKKQWFLTVHICIRGTDDSTEQKEN